MPRRPHFSPAIATLPLNQWSPMSHEYKISDGRSEEPITEKKTLVENLLVTYILDNLTEMKSNSETDNYRYVDHKMLWGDDHSVPQTKNLFQEVIVFAVGGGNYIEYQNLVDHIKGKQDKHIVFWLQ